MNTDQRLTACKLACTCLVIAISVPLISLIQIHNTDVKQAVLIESQKNTIAAAAQKSKTQDALYGLLQEKYNLIVAPVDYTRDSIPLYSLPLSDDLQRYTYETCIKYGIVDDYTLVLALMWQESNFNANEISSTNDYGLMQINKSNHKWIQERLGTSNFLDPQQNIDAGTYIIASLLRQYPSKTKALMIYNMGSRVANKCIAAGTTSTQYSRGVLQYKLQLDSGTLSK